MSLPYSHRLVIKTCLYPTKALVYIKPFQHTSWCVGKYAHYVAELAQSHVK